MFFAHAKARRASKMQSIYVTAVNTTDEPISNSGLGQWPVRNCRPAHGQGERATSEVEDANNLSDLQLEHTAADEIAFVCATKSCKGT